MSKKKANKPVDTTERIKQFPKDNTVVDSKPKPKDTSKVQKVYWSFGFKFFEQKNYFGLNTVDNSWFVSLLSRLKETSNMEYSGSTQVLKDGLRYHKISWSARNVPLQRDEFEWVNKYYLENEQEYPFYQFHISKGKGRVIGFWDESNVFQVLLLDPLHNLQPSNYTKYKLRECYPVLSEFDSIHHGIQNVLKNTCDVTECKVYHLIKGLPSYSGKTNVLLAHLDDDFLNAQSEILKSKTFSEILEAGILTLTK